MFALLRSGLAARVALRGVLREKLERVYYTGFDLLLI